MTSDSHPHPHEHSHNLDDNAHTTAILAAENITCMYPGAVQPALESATLHIHPGQHIGVIGHNGSGKTTLFHVLMGLMRPQAGQVRFRDAIMDSPKAFQALRREVGFLFQQSDDQLFSPTVLEDVAFGPLNLGLSADQARERALETLRSLHMEGFADRVTHRLSGGEKKMAALASVLAMRPQVLLLDEPTNDLDPGTRERLIEHINSLPMARCIISHDWDFLEQTCSRFVSLKDGRVHESAHVPHVHVHIHDGGDVEHKHADCDV